MRLAIVHPWLPQYRVAFFKSLLEVLSAEDIHCTVYYGRTPPEWAARMDGGTLDSAVALPTRFVRVGSKSLVWKDLSPLKLGPAPPTHIIVEQAIRNVESYAPLFLGSRLRGTKIGMWGHGRHYTADTGAASAALLRSLTRRADWFFSYTEGGARAIAAWGFPSTRTTVVENAIDTTQLRVDLESVTQRDVERFRDDLGLTHRTAAYIGGLDGSKRIDFLLNALERAFAEDPALRVVIAGDGTDASVVRDFAARHAALVYIGPQFGRDKALLLRASRLLLNPGRVGLIAVDSLTSGTPILTTSWPYHAPEFEYLIPGETCLVSPDDAASYAEHIVSIFESSSRLEQMRSACISQSARFSIERMAGNFAAGVMAWRSEAT